MHLTILRQPVLLKTLSDAILLNKLFPQINLMRFSISLFLLMHGREEKTGTCNVNDSPIVSVVMPVFNGERYLREAIDSILWQSFTDFELLIINDGSTDNSRAIIELYDDERIRLIDNERNLGLIATLNKGIELARGKYIARMDADDVSYPQRFEKQVRLMDFAGADICGCHWFTINETGKLIEAKLVPLCRDTFTIFLACTVPFAHGSVMMRADFIRKHSLKYGGVRYAEDYDLWTKFYEMGAIFANVDDFLFKYRELSSSLSKRMSKENASDTKALRRRFVRDNSDACQHAIRVLTKRYSSLNQAERVFLLLTSYLVSMDTKRLIVIDVFRQSASRSIGMAMLYLLRGV